MPRTLPGRSDNLRATNIVPPGPLALRPRKHRARTLAPIVLLFAVAFVGVTHYLYPDTAADLVDQVRGFVGHLASLVRPDSGSA